MDYCRNLSSSGKGVIPAGNEPGICVNEHGSEPGNVRYPRGGDILPPRVATWRNNLTALSQHRNLYFVSYARQIYVYQPSGYSQAIGSTPELILTPTVKNINASGFISVQTPHAINSIIVGELGHEEILLLAADSGNVAAYRTEHIFDAIQEKENSDNWKPEIAGGQVECFFSEWVGQSAWGLAIHKFARLIAVSSNTSHVTVFAFALVDKSSADLDDDERTPFSRLEHDSHSEWFSVTGHSQYASLRRWSPQHRRSRNLRLTLFGHDTNIPNVSFLNSDLDSDGNWLFSTDIDNKLLAWHIWDRPKPVQSWDMHGTQRGWNVLAIDPRVFRMKQSLFAACGAMPTADQRGVRHLPPSRIQVPDCNRYYDFFPPMELPGPNSCPHDHGGPPSDESFSASFEEQNPSPDSLTTTEMSDNDPGQEGGGNEMAAGNPNELRGEATTSGHNYGDYSQDGVSALSNDAVPAPEADIPLIVDAGDERTAGGWVPDLPALIPRGPEDPFWATDHEDEGPGPEDTDEVNSPYSPDESPAMQLIPRILGLSQGILGGEESDFELTDWGGPWTEQEQDPEDASDGGSKSTSENAVEPVDRLGIFNHFPILHFSESHIRMIPGPYAPRPSVVFHDPLFQALRSPVPTIEACDRFNMIQHIPELGVVVAASQKGRVAVISLAQTQKEGMFPRVDRIAPFESQEKFGLRPLCPLLGIAVGPVESHLIPLDAANPSREDDDDGEISADLLEPKTYRDGTSAPSKPQNQDPETDHSHSPKGSRSPPFPPHDTSKRENWHGSEYSRRYRLFLMYCDHTVLHYEIYYDWPRDTRGDEGAFMDDADQPFFIRP